MIWVVSFSQKFNSKLLSQLLVYLSDFFVKVCCAFIEEIVLIVLSKRLEIINIIFPTHSWIYEVFFFLVLIKWFILRVIFYSTLFPLSFLLYPSLLSFHLFFLIKDLIIELLYISFYSLANILLIVGSCNHVVKKRREGIATSILIGRSSIKLMSASSVTSCSSTRWTSVAEIRGTPLGVLLQSLDLEEYSLASEKLAIAEVPQFLGHDLQ